MGGSGKKGSTFYWEETGGANSELPKGIRRLGKGGGSRKQGRTSFEKYKHKPLEKEEVGYNRDPTRKKKKRDGSQYRKEVEEEEGRKSVSVGAGRGKRLYETSTNHEKVAPSHPGGKRAQKVLSRKYIKLTGGHRPEPLVRSNNKKKRPKRGQPKGAGRRG